MRTSLVPTGEVEMGLGDRSFRPIGFDKVECMEVHCRVDALSRGSRFPLSVSYAEALTWESRRWAEALSA